MRSFMDRRKASAKRIADRFNRHVGALVRCAQRNIVS